MLHNYDVLLYTSTLTAGVSIDSISVDKVIVVHSKNANTPFSTIQASFRCRNTNGFIIYVPE